MGGQRLKDERNWVGRGGENVSPEAQAAAAQAAMCAGTRSTDRQCVRVTGVYVGGKREARLEEPPPCPEEIGNDHVLQGRMQGPGRGQGRACSSPKGSLTKRA